MHRAIPSLVQKSAHRFGEVVEGVRVGTCRWRVTQAKAGIVRCDHMIVGRQQWDERIELAR